MTDMEWPKPAEYKTLREFKIVPSAFNFPGIVTITIDPPGLVLAEGVDWDETAKKFWNAVSTVIGHEKLFPDV